MRSLLFAAAAAIFAVSAHADVTPYQPGAPRNSYGWAETQLDVNRVRVSFRGNDDTPLERVEMYLLYRAAETTLARGYDYFIVIDHNVETTTDFNAAGPPVPPFIPARRYHQDTRHQAVSDILMQRGERPASMTNAFDARTVRANLAYLAHVNQAAR